MKCCRKYMKCDYQNMHKNTLSMSHFCCSPRWHVSVAGTKNCVTPKEEVTMILILYNYITICLFIIKNEATVIWIYQLQKSLNLSTSKMTPKVCDFKSQITHNLFEALVNIKTELHDITRSALSRSEVISWSVSQMTH